MGYENMGHNEATVRLGLLADDARNGLARVADGEADTIEGWLAYGAALNEGRGLFHPEDDKGFGQWVSDNLLSQVATVEVTRDDRAAAMWAAREPEQFEQAQAQGKARTVRGIYAKWNEMNAEKEAQEKREAAEAEQQRAEAERLEAEEARRIAGQRAAEAEATAKAEADAHRAAQEARDEAERREAQARHQAAAEAREKAELAAREADEKAAFNEATAKSAAINANKSGKAAMAAEKRVQKMQSGKDRNVHVSNNSGENEWYTPKQYISSARLVMGAIDLDPATSEFANRTVQASVYYTAQDDGLVQNWPIGRIWMNPPYAQPLMGQFAEKLSQEVERGSEAVVLVNNATETAWFQRMTGVCSAICFPRGRIRFLDPQGNLGAPLQGQAIIYFGKNTADFYAEFSQYGLVVSHG